MRKLQRFWSEFRDQPWIFQFGEMLAIALISLGLLMPGVAKAGEMVARNGSDEVRVSDKPCANGAVVEHIRLAGGNVDTFREAAVRFGGKSYAACYRVAGGFVHLVYEDGDQGIVPTGEFKEPNSI
jgi:hypothetical protein